MAYATNDERLVYMINTGLFRLLNPFGALVNDIRIDRIHDTMEVRVWCKIEMNGESMAQSTNIDHWQLRDNPAEAANAAIYDLLKAFVPIEDIKEAVADESLPVGVLDHLNQE